MPVSWTGVQRQRLFELNAGQDLEDLEFETKEERDRVFQAVEQQLIGANRERLSQLREVFKRPAVARLEQQLTGTLVGLGFVQVQTPILMAKGLLARMSITEDHPLYKQVYWVDKGRCLRPMLAPHLYTLLRQLVRLWEKPVRIFEVGPCFRKESRGSLHLSEFTMLNLVELGLPEEQCNPRLIELFEKIARACGLQGYELRRKGSEVYGETIDLVVSGIEVGSAAIGPHFLDEKWGIFDPWVGIGLGLERLVLVREGFRNIQRVGRSLIYLDGARLNI